MEALKQELERFNKIISAYQALKQLNDYLEEENMRLAEKIREKVSNNRNENATNN